MKSNITHCPFCGCSIDAEFAAFAPAPPVQLLEADLELLLESSLMDAFPSDDFRLAADPESAGDIVQHVKNGGGDPCGSVVWRPCADRVWHPDPVKRLEVQVQGINKAQCVLVSPMLPKSAKPFLLVGNVWVAEPEAAVALGVCLRLALIHLNVALGPTPSLADTTQAVCRYLEGSSFRDSVGAVIANYLSSRSLSAAALMGTVHLN